MALHFFRSNRAQSVEPALWFQRISSDEPVRLGPGDNRYAGSSDVVDWVYGQAGDDNIQGVGGDDILRGGAGDDFLSGGKNRDLLFGGDGDDDIAAGGGNDVIVGGAGTDSISLDSLIEGNSDRVVFNAVSDSRPGSAHDTIYQFVTGEDRIDLRRIDADVSTPDNDAFHWIGREAFGGVAGELRYEQSTQLLQGDIDGDRIADFEVFFNSGVRVVVAETDILL